MLPNPHVRNGFADRLHHQKSGIFRARGFESAVYHIVLKYKIAAIATRSKRERVSCDSLHNLSSCDILFPEKKRKREKRGLVVKVSGYMKQSA